MDEFFQHAMWALSWLCHQRPERSPHLWEWQFPLCWRCSGILAGLIVFVLLLIATRRLPALNLSVALCLPLPLDVLLAVAGVWSGANGVRCVTGAMWGVGAMSVLLHAALAFAARERKRDALTTDSNLGSMTG
jgi:uncharacterized membrane protein